MVINTSPHFGFSSTFTPNNGSSPTPNSLQYNCAVCPFSLNFDFDFDFDLPHSKFDHSPASTGQVHLTFACEESGEGSPGLGWGSASMLEEAPHSKHGRESRRKLGGTRGSRERGMNKSGHTVYKGVRKRKGGRWVSEIREPGTKSRIWLGTFSTPEMAAAAYDVAAFNLKTPFAYLNFPEYVSSLPILSSRSPKNIQEAAAAGAAVAPLRGFATRNTGGLVATPTPQIDETSTSSFTERQSTAMETRASPLIDEDMIFDMPSVLTDMAEGLMITPPLHYHATPTNAYDHNAECTLWNL